MSEKLLHFLQRLSHYEFVLHGSPRRFDVLEPRQAYESSGDWEKGRFAVYASLMIEFALLRAIIHSDPDSWGWTCDFGRIRVYGEEPHTLGHGFLYILPRSEFTLLSNGLWCVAHRPVQPIAVAEVPPLFYRHFPWIDFEPGFLQPSQE